MTRAIWAAVAILALAAIAWADGGIYPRAAVVKPVRTPDQRALLHFDGTTETLVIETTLQGEGRDFAWILPLPAAPKIEASTTGLFPTLEVMCAPRVWTKPESVWVLLAIPWAVFMYVAIRRWGFRGGLLAYIVGGALVGIAAIEVPTMKGDSGPLSAGVRVVSRETVGAFDTATLAATDAASLHRWLDANGFRAPESIDPVVAEYVREGWVFVASKVHRDAEDDAVRRVHPLAFTFPAKEGVYPMRLTGAGNDSLALELFVFGDLRAEADGLDVVHCDDSVREMLDPKDADPRWHTELRRRALGATVLTKLTGTLNRAAMSRDVAIRWTDYARARTTYFAPRVALSQAGTAAAVTFAFVLVVAAVFRRRGANAGRAAPPWSESRDVGVAAAAGALTLGMVCLLLPRLPDGGHELNRDWLTGPFRRDCMPATPIRDVAAARAWAAARSHAYVNQYTDEPVQEEDSLGNYLVRERDGRVELVQYDAYSGSVYEVAVDLSRDPTAHDR